MTDDIWENELRITVYVSVWNSRLTIGEKKDEDYGKMGLEAFEETQTSVAGNGESELYDYKAYWQPFPSFLKYVYGDEKADEMMEKSLEQDMDIRVESFDEPEIEDALGKPIAPGNKSASAASSAAGAAGAGIERRNNEPIVSTPRPFDHNYA